MLDINEKNHVSVVIGSLDKIYKDAKIYGKLYPKDIYLLEAVYKLLSGCDTALLNTQRRILLSLYNKILYQSKNICPVILEQYKVEPKPKFIQAETQDCNNYPVYNKIFYWQEDSYLTTESILIPIVDDTGFFSNKLFDTFPVFETGKDIEYNNIGRVCFAVMEATDSATYEIKDALNNIVTHTFDSVFIDQINTTLFVSQNIYSHGNMTFKIKKLT